VKNLQELSEHITTNLQDLAKHTTNAATKINTNMLETTW
jgi:hypothetical protein